MANSKISPSPHLNSDDRARSQQIAAQFAAQIELSMMQTLNQMSSATQESEENGGSDNNSVDIGLDSQMQQLLLMSSVISRAKRSGTTSAQLQAQLAALGIGSQNITGTGAGSDAQLAQQLLGSLIGVSQSAAEVGSVRFSGSVDAGAKSNAKIVADIARKHGVDPVAAVAMMLVESGGRANAVGDGGTSFGLFQLHQGGMLTAAKLTPEQAFDARTNATVALQSFAHEWAKGHARRTPGEIAAASQRPADPSAYAAKVNGAMDRARALLTS